MFTDFTKWLNNDGNVDFEKTKELISEIDAKAQELKQAILNTKDTKEVKGKSYFVSEKNGNDDNDGLSPETAWKTVKNVNDGPVTYFDGVFFERGGIYRGRISCKAGVTYAAYGEGEKPRIYGSPENGSGEEKWSLLEGTDNIWVYYKKMTDVGVIVLDEGKECSFKLIPSFVGGKYVVRLDHSIEFDVRKHLDRDLALFCDNSSELSDTGLPKIDVPGTVYLRCDKGNPGKLYSSIEFADRGNILRVGGWFNVHVDNLAIMYGGCHGVGAGTCKGLHVTNCVFGWIGGCIQFYNASNGNVVRFGNAIEIYGGCDNYICDHNYIYQVYDAGVTHQLSAGGDGDCKQKNASYTNNLFEYCIYSIEYFLGKPNTVDAVRFQQNILIKDNILRWSGFGFGEQRPESDNPAAHIKGWDHYNPLDENFVIKNNIFDRSRNMMIHCGASKKSWLPTFEDNIFVQYLDEPRSSLGRYKTNPTTLVPFDKDVRKSMNEMEFDKTAGVYFAQRDELYDLPDFSPKECRG